MKFPTEWKVIKAMFQTTNQFILAITRIIPSGKHTKNYGKSQFLGLKVPGANPILYRSLTVLNFGFTRADRAEIEDGETPI